MEIKRATLSDTWLLSCMTVLTKGNDVIDENGKKTKEIENLIMITSTPVSNYLNSVKAIPLPKDFYWNRNQLMTYAEQLMDPNEKDFVYDYGNRLRSYFGIDQINAVVNRLKNNSKSRRAIAVTIDPKKDYKEEEIPCLQNIVFLIRNNALNITAFFRSNDIGYATFSNQFALSHVGCYISNKLGIKMGKLTVHSVSAHIYDTDIETIKKILKQNGWSL